MPACVAQIADGAADILDDRRLDAFGRLVEHQQLRPHDQRAADGELLLLAAGEVAAAPRRASASAPGTARRRASGMCGRRASAAQSRIRGSPSPSAAERSRGPAARRRCPTGRDRTPRSGRAPSPRRLSLPDVSRCWPTIARIRLVLPTPLRPSTQVILPASAVSDTPRSAWAAP